MPSKMIFLFFALVLLVSMAIFAWTNPSYQKAFEAKWYYFMGDYDKAYQVAKEAYKSDPYNRMALTVMTRTAIAQRYLGYIEEGMAYLRKIDTIAEHPPISEADRLRIKMICEVMMARYKNFKPTPLTDEKLAEEARRVYEKFQILYNQLFKGTSKNR